MPHDGDESSELSPIALRVRALELLLVEKGYVDPAALDLLIETYETRIGPRNGARVVATAWTDAGYADWLKRDATAAIESLGYTGRQGEHMVALFNTPQLHNMVVCTLCSCYPWPVLGLPPVWYKSAPYRSRAVIDPRNVLAEFGTALPHETEIRVWDSTAEVRYLVIPLRPEGTDGWDEVRLAGLVTRDAMIGTALGKGRTMNGGQDAGGMMGFGPVAPEADEPVFHAEWEQRVFALTVAMGMTGSWNIDISRHARERRPPQEYWSSSYYEIWLKGLERLLMERGLVSNEELTTGRAGAESKPLARRPEAADIPGIIATGGPASRPSTAPARFAAGDKVRSRNINPAGHTRLPRYVRGRVGIIATVHGTHVFPDANAHGGGEAPQWLYTVCFTARELWGHDNADTVTADLWESRS